MATIAEISSRYPERIVIIDSPPVLHFADAQVLSTRVDGVLFVVREGFARPTDVKKSMVYLQDANVLGVVYNGATHSKKSGYYEYYSSTEKTGS